ncbi:hypothetical protein Bca52824_076713 [Brassica carinata]|uniref:F-box domain-containing protein n=1 Tax=Brassica carinata TaxID=52824 RepID=A0A8X7PS59_BRACI|nr:hypothetical protein Bca52824_076713 [Brassica carinata]
MVESSSLIPGLVDDLAELCLSRIPRSSFQIISQVCWRWRRFLRSERYGAVRKLTGSVEELMCLLVYDKYWEVFDGSGNKLDGSSHPWAFEGRFRPCGARWRKDCVHRWKI